MSRFVRWAGIALLAVLAVVPAARQAEAHDLYALPLHREIVEGKLIDVGHQVGFPIAVGHMLVVAQKFVAGVKAIAMLPCLRCGF